MLPAGVLNSARMLTFNVSFKSTVFSINFCLYNLSCSSPHSVCIYPLDGFVCVCACVFRLSHCCFNETKVKLSDFQEITAKQAGK